jgi:ABC-2 type transport system permease protein
MNWHVIPTLAAKDLTLFFRNRFFAVISVLALVAYSAMYFLMPKSADEMIEIGLVAPELPASVSAELEGEGLILYRFGSEDELKEGLVQGDYAVGLVLPAGFPGSADASQATAVHLYFASDFPEDMREAYGILFREFVLALAGEPLNVEVEEEVLGIDLAGRQVAPRDRLLPLVAVFVLMMETLGLSALLGNEIETGTVRALLVTPMRVPDLFVGKAVSGVGMAFGQAALLMAITGGLSDRLVLILVSLFLGAFLVTGIGFLLASSGGEMMSVMAWGVLAILVLAVPAFGILLPGLVSEWVKVIPSYYLVDTVHQVANLGAGWDAVWTNLLVLLAFGLGFFWLGIVVLRRKLS